MMGPSQRNRRKPTARLSQIRRPTPFRELDTTPTSRHLQDVVNDNHVQSMPSLADDFIDGAEDSELMSLDDSINPSFPRVNYPWSEAGTNTYHSSPSDILAANKELDFKLEEIASEDPCDGFTSPRCETSKLPETQPLPPESNLRKTRGAVDFSATASTGPRSSSFRPHADFTSPQVWDFRSPSYATRTATIRRRTEAPSTLDGFGVSPEQSHRTTDLGPPPRSISPYNIENVESQGRPESEHDRIASKGLDAPTKKRRQRPKVPVQFDSTTQVAKQSPKNDRNLDRPMNVVPTGMKAKPGRPRKVNTPATIKGREPQQMASVTEDGPDSPEQGDPPPMIIHKKRAESSVFNSDSLLALNKFNKDTTVQHDVQQDATQPQKIKAVSDTVEEPMQTLVSLAPASMSPGKHPATALIIPDSASSSSLSDADDYYPSPEPTKRLLDTFLKDSDALKSKKPIEKSAKPTDYAEECRRSPAPELKHVAVGTDAPFPQPITIPTLPPLQNFRSKYEGLAVQDHAAEINHDVSPSTELSSKRYVYHGIESKVVPHNTSHDMKETMNTVFHGQKRQATPQVSHRSVQEVEATKYMKRSRFSVSEKGSPERAAGRHSYRVRSPLQEPAQEDQEILRRPGIDMRRSFAYRVNEAGSPTGESKSPGLASKHAPAVPNPSNRQGEATQFVAGLGLSQRSLSRNIGNPLQGRYLRQSGYSSQWTQAMMQVLDAELKETATEVLRSGEAYRQKMARSISKIKQRFENEKTSVLQKWREDGMRFAHLVQNTAAATPGDFMDRKTRTKNFIQILERQHKTLRIALRKIHGISQRLEENNQTIK